MYILENEALVSKGGQSCLHEQTMFLCAIAESTLDNMCQGIYSGDITIEELDGISAPTRKKQIQKLCLAAKKDGIEEALEQKLSEVSEFKRYREDVGLICDHVLGIHVKGKISCFYVQISKQIN